MQGIMWDCHEKYPSTVAGEEDNGMKETERRLLDGGRGAFPGPPVPLQIHKPGNSLSYAVISFMSFNKSIDISSVPTFSHWGVIS